MDNLREVIVTEEIGVPAEFLWQTISDFEHIDRWTALKVRSIDGHGIGCKRTVEMESGLLVTEQLRLCDHENMIFSYAILAPNPYPMRDYASTMKIEKIPDQRSRLDWTGRYVPLEGNDPARTDNLLRKVYAAGIALLCKHYLDTQHNSSNQDARTQDQT